MTNASITAALEELLGKPVSESRVLDLTVLPRVKDTGYVGLSAASMIMTSHGTTFGCHTLPPGTPTTLGPLNIAILPHADHGQFPDNSMADLEIEAAGLPVPSYAIDDHAGNSKRFNAGRHAETPT